MKSLLTTYHSFAANSSEMHNNSSLVPISPNLSWTVTIFRYIELFLVNVPVHWLGHGHHLFTSRAYTWSVNNGNILIME